MGYDVIEILGLLSVKVYLDRRFRDKLLQLQQVASDVKGLGPAQILSCEQTLHWFIDITWYFVEHICMDLIRLLRGCFGERQYTLL